MRALGLDGFRKGWVAAGIDGDKRSIHFLNDIQQVNALPFDRMAIDIPIGMTEDGERDCDMLAREMLRPHSSRVFNGARRWLWQEFPNDPDLANKEATRRRQKRVSRQLWHLGRKIMEVDRFVTSNPNIHIRETHPELVFLRLCKGVPLPSKRTPAGLAQRRDLLAREFPEIDHWLGEKRRGKGVKADDVLDACACALAAREGVQSLPTGEAPRDANNLPMQIWY